MEDTGKSGIREGTNPRTEKSSLRRGKEERECKREEGRREKMQMRLEDNERRGDSYRKVRGRKKEKRERGG